MDADTNAAAVERAGKLQTYEVGGLDCTDCARHLEQALAALPGMVTAEVHFATARARLRASEPAVLEAAARTARALGFALIGEHDQGRRSPSHRLVMTVGSGLLLLAGWGLGGLLPALPGSGEGFTLPPATMAHWSQLAAVLLGGWHIFRAALGGLRNRLLTVDVLVTIAVTAAVLTGEAIAAGQVVVLMSIGQLLEERTVSRTRLAVRQLLDLAPQTVTVVGEDGERQVPRDQVRPGDVLLVRPGGRVPVDGTVVGGRADVSEAPITGESRLVPKAPGDQAFAGSLAEDGALTIRADLVGPDTTLARIGAMIEDAQSRQAPVQRLVDRFATVFIPLTLVAAGTVYLVTGEILRAVTILIGSCPCALVLATPVAMFASIGAASRRGLLVKGGLFMERVGRVGVVAFDKTGTLTSGTHTVLATYPAEAGNAAAAGQPIGSERLQADELLALAAAVESQSEHPVGKAIARAAQAAGLKVAAVSQFRAEPGCGVTGLVDGHQVLAGNLRWLQEQGVAVPGQVNEQAVQLAEQGLSLVVVALDGVAAGVIALSDELRPDAAQAIAELRALGIVTHLLSGDSPPAVARVAAELGMTHFQGGMMPGDKVDQVAKLAASGAGLVMVGDGINDAPALAAATVGVAVGRTGSDLAIEAADVVLLSDDLRRVPELIRLGRRTLNNIRVNIILSGLAIAGLFAGAAAGVVGPVTGALVHEGSALLVTLNAMRLLRAPAQERGRRAAEHRPHVHQHQHQHQVGAAGGCGHDH